MHAAHLVAREEDSLRIPSALAHHECQPFSAYGESEFILLLTAKVRTEPQKHVISEHDSQSDIQTASRAALSEFSDATAKYPRPGRKFLALDETTDVEFATASEHPQATTRQAIRHVRSRALGHPGSRPAGYRNAPALPAPLSGHCRAHRGSAPQPQCTHTDRLKHVVAIICA